MRRRVSERVGARARRLLGVLLLGVLGTATFSAAYSPLLLGPAPTGTEGTSVVESRGAPRAPTGGEPVPSQVSILASDPDADEFGEDPGAFTIVRSGMDFASDLIVQLDVDDGTAEAGTDHEAIPTTARIQSGSATVDIVVQPIDDDDVEGPETVIIRILDAATYDVGPSDGATVTIADSERPTVTVSAAGAPAEGGAIGSFTFTRAGDLSSDLLVTYVVSGSATNGADYRVLPGLVRIPAGSATAGEAVEAVDDAEPEATETVAVTLQSSPDYVPGSPGLASLDLVDNDAGANAGTSNYHAEFTFDPPLASTDANQKFTFDAQGNVTVTVTLHRANGSPKAFAEGEARLVATSPSGLEVTKLATATGASQNTAVFTLDRDELVVDDLDYRPWALRVESPQEPVPPAPSGAPARSFAFYNQFAAALFTNSPALADLADGLPTPVAAPQIRSLRIRDAANGLGSESGAMSLTADDAETLFAAGYDALDAYAGDVVASWSVTTQTGPGLGEVLPATGTSTTFAAAKIGTGFVGASYPSGEDAVTDETGTITVTAGDPVSLGFLTVPSPVASLDEFTVTVGILDGDGNVDSTATDGVTLAKSAGPAAGVLGGTLTLAASGGVATFADLTLDVADPETAYTLEASTTGLTSDTSGSITIVPGDPASLNFFSHPSTAVAGAAFSAGVEVLDAGLNRVEDDGIVVLLAVKTGPAEFVASSTASATTVDGLASFTNLILGTVGDYTVEASNGTLTKATSATITVEPGAPAKLGVSSIPASNVRALVDFTVSVEVLDSSDNVNESATNAVTLAIETGPAGATLAGTTTVNAVTGTAVFADLTLDKVGDYTLGASSSSLTPDATDTIAIVPGDAARLFFRSLDASAVAGVGFDAEVEVLDAGGNLDTSAANSITLTIVTGPSEADPLGGTTTRAAVNGVASFDDLTLTTTGVYTLGADASGLAGAASPTMAIVVGPPTQLAFVDLDEVGSTGSPIEAHVEILDAGGNRNTTASASVTLTIANGPAGAALGGTTTASSSAGVAAFDDLTLSLAGAYTLSASASGLASATSGTITVTSPSAATVTVSPDDVLVVVEGTVTFTATGTSPEGAPTPVTPTWSVADASIGSIDATTGAFTALSAGSTTVTATDAATGVSASASVQVLADAGTVTAVTITPSDATVTAGATQTFTVSATDVSGRTVRGAKPAFLVNAASLGAVSSTGELRAAKAGSGTLTATVNGIAAIATLTVVPGPLARLVASPVSATLGAGEALSFTAKGFDARNNLLSSVSIAWSVDEPSLGASIASGGEFTAGPHEGTATVRAASGAVVALVAVHVTTLEVAADQTEVVEAAVQASTVDGVEVVQFAAGAAKADAGATLQIVPPAGTSSSFSSADVTLDASVTNLALTIEAQGGSLDVLPAEVEPDALRAALDGLAGSTAPSLFLTIGASVGGASLDSDTLNQVLRRVSVSFDVPAAYFAASGLPPTSARLLEFSNGALVNANVPVVLLTPHPVGGAFRYRADLEQFSSFAVVSVPPPSGGGGGGGTGVCDLAAWTLRGLPASLSQASLSFATLQCLNVANNLGVREWAATSRPAAWPAVPAGIAADRYLELTGLPAGTVLDAARFDLAIPAAAVPSGVDRLVVYTIEGAAWRLVDVADLTPAGSLVRAVVESRCCTAFLLGFDVAPPVLAIGAIPDVVDGTLTIPLVVTDNVGLDGVDLHVDGRCCSRDAEAPFEFVLDSTALVDGVHALRFVAVDVAGNAAEATASILVVNSAWDGDAARPGGPESTASGASLAAWLAWSGAGLALLGAAAAALYLKWGPRRRPTEDAPVPAPP